MTGKQLMWQDKVRFAPKAVDGHPREGRVA
jgi:hypothetical protein